MKSAARKPYEVYSEVLALDPDNKIAATGAGATP